MTAIYISKFMLCASSVFKYCILGIYVIPYLQVCSLGEQIHTLQLISTIGVGIAGLHDLFSICAPEKKSENTSCIDTCVLSIVYSTPFVCICWLIHMIRIGEMEPNDITISNYIIVLYFTTPIILISMLILSFLYTTCAIGTKKCYLCTKECCV